MLQTQHSEHSLARWWNSWRRRRAAAAELRAVPREILADLARDTGVSVTELRTLAAMDSDASALLLQRLQALKLDAAAVARREPGLMRDMHKLCSLCTSKGQCRRDLAADPSNPHWHDYCPNAATLDEMASTSAAGR